MTAPGGPGPLTTGGITVSIALPPLPFTGGPATERRRVELGSGTLLVALGSLALLALILGTTAATLVVAGVIGVGLVVAAVMVPAVALALLVVGEFANVSGVFVAHGLPGVFTPLLGIGLLSALVATRSAQNRARLASVPRAPALLLAVYIASVMPAVLISSDATATAEKVQELWSTGCPGARPGAGPARRTAVGHRGDDRGAARRHRRDDRAQPAVPAGDRGLLFARISKALGEATTTPRYAGPMEDSNFWGRVLVLGCRWRSRCPPGHRREAPAASTGWIVSVLLLFGPSTSPSPGAP
jgi:hypothetical protein